MSVTATALIYAVGFVGTVVVGLLSKWIDRKVSAKIQWRVGPPWYQPLVDIIKLLGKETIVPEAARKTGFLLAPLVGLAAVSVAAAILWAVNINSDYAFVGDVIVVLYLLTIPAIAIIAGGAASGNPHGVVGASREMKILLAYELPFILAILCAIIAKGNTFRLGDLVTINVVGVWGVAGSIIALIVAVFCIQAKLGLPPFDMAEAETEIMGGVYVEYSGAPLAVIQLTRAMMLATLPIFLVTVFWGGFSFRSWAILGSILKYVVILVVLILVKNTNPRLRIDHALKFFWFILTPVAVLAVILSFVSNPL
jgi:NADH-quinone oxidoreductase subunit H